MMVRPVHINIILEFPKMQGSFARFRWCARCQVLYVWWHERWASGVSLKRAFRNTYFRSLVHFSQKLWLQPDKGNFAPCILPCKIGGSQNLMIFEQTTLSNICLSKKMYHKSALHFWKFQKCWVVYVTNVTLGVLLEYCSFINFWEAPILQGRIHGAKLP